MKRIESSISITMVLFFVVLLSFDRAYSRSLVCGIAKGFPPYQFHEKGEVKGFDADVAKLIFKRLNKDFEFLQDDWDHVFNQLRYGKIDFIAGMEINDLRKTFFDFTDLYYHRYDVVFIKEESSEITNVEDLYNQIITGDRHSFVEQHWDRQGLKNKIRIMQTQSKERSMELLCSGKTKAAIMPKAVGLYLAKKNGCKIRILMNPDPGSPVAIAVKKGNSKLLKTINTELQGLINEGEIKALYEKWF